MLSARPCGLRAKLVWHPRTGSLDESSCVAAVVLALAAPRHAPPPGRALASRATLARRAAPARGRPLRPRRRSTGAAGQRALPDALARRPLERAGARPRPRRTTCPTAAPRAARGLAARQPVLDRRRRRAPGAQASAGRPRARLLRPQRRSSVAPARQPRWPSTPTIVTRASGARTSRSAARRRATPTASTSRSSTTRPARTPTRASQSASIVRGDRGLPRRGQRLERHRLQLPRRQVRPGLRRPVRRHDADRDRRARGGVQHRRASASRCSGTTRRGPTAAAARRRSSTARLAARPGARRPALEGRARLGGQPALPAGRRSRCAPSRATATPAPRAARATRSTRSCPRSRARRRADGAAEALRADGRPARSAGRSASRRGSRARPPWTVTVKDAAGTVVASGSGTGTAVDWTWDAIAVPGQRYSWTIAAPDLRSASGTIGQPVLRSVSSPAPGSAAAAPRRRSGAPAARQLDQQPAPVELRGRSRRGARSPEGPRPAAAGPAGR